MSYNQYTEHLVEALTWRSGSESFVCLLENEYLDHILQLFDNFVIALRKNDRSMAELVAFLLDELEPIRFRSLITSSSATAILRHLKVENYPNRLVVECGIVFRDWLRIEVSPDQQDRSWACDGAFKAGVKALHLTDRVTIDFDAPGIWTHYDAGITSFLEHSQSEKESILKTVTDARQILSSHDTILSFIERFTHIIHFRKTPERPNIGSSTNAMRIGAASIRNAHLLAGDPIRLAELMVHESIHNYLGRYEVLFGHFVDQALDLPIESPWSGNIIPVQAYTQACYVWFGLWHFYELVSEQTNFPKAQQMRRKAALGYWNGLVHPIWRERGKLSQQLLSDIGAMESIVRSTLDDCDNLEKSKC